MRAHFCSRTIQRGTSRYLAAALLVGACNACGRA
jgi:hypothetical protein